MSTHQLLARRWQAKYLSMLGLVPLVEQFNRAFLYAKRKDAEGQRGFSDEGGQWITIGGEDFGEGAKHVGGTPVKVDGSGRITAGPDALAGKSLNKLDRDVKGTGKDRRKQLPAPQQDRIGEGHAFRGHGKIPGGGEPFKVLKIQGDKALIGYDRGHENDWTATIPVSALSQWVNDMQGKVAGTPDSQSEHVNALIRGGGELLGKGDDGLAFGVGSKVVKASAVAPAVWSNPGQRTPEEASAMLAKQVGVNEALRRAGVQGLLHQELHQHGGRSFAVMDRLHIPEKFTPAQLDQVRDAVESIHAAGYSVNDQIQAGIGADGRVYLYDIGKAEKLPAEGSSDRKYRIQDDYSHLSRLYQQSGEEFKGTAKTAVDEFDDVFHMAFNRADKAMNPKSAAMHLERVEKAYDKLKQLDPDSADFYGDGYESLVGKLRQHAGQEQSQPFAPQVGGTVSWASKTGPVDAEYRGKTMGMEGPEATIIVRNPGSAPYQTTVPFKQLSSSAPKAQEDAPPQTPIAQPASKERGPHQTNRLDFINSHPAVLKAKAGLESARNAPRAAFRDKVLLLDRANKKHEAAYKAAGDEHRRHVLKAIKKGEQLPPEVAKDYRDLEKFRPAPKPPKPEKQPRKSRVTAQAKDIIAEYAQKFDVDPHDLADAIEIVWQEKNQHTAGTVEAMQDVRKIAGLNARSAHKWEDKGKDHSTWPKFDVAVQAAMNYPELGLSNSGDAADRLWELVKQGAGEQLPKHDPEIVKEAAELVKSQSGRPANYDELMAIPFQKRGMIERYLKRRELRLRNTMTLVQQFNRAFSQAALKYSRWNESEHPRDDDGQFAEASKPKGRRKSRNGVRWRHDTTGLPTTATHKPRPKDDDEDAGLPVKLPKGRGHKQIAELMKKHPIDLKRLEGFTRSLIGDDEHVDWHLKSALEQKPSNVSKDVALAGMLLVLAESEIGHGKATVGEEAKATRRVLSDLWHKSAPEGKASYRRIGLVECFNRAFQESYSEEQPKKPGELPNLEGWDKPQQHHESLRGQKSLFGDQPSEGGKRDSIRTGQKRLFNAGKGKECYSGGASLAEMFKAAFREACCA